MMRALFLVVLAVGQPAIARAQRSVEQNIPAPGVNRMSQTTNIQSSCDYNTCALRLKPTVGPWKIVRGSNGQEVGTLGMLRPPNLAALVADVPDAVAEARVAQRSYRRSAAALWGGSVLAFAGVLFSVGSDMHVVGTTVGFVGIAGMVVGSIQHPKSIDMLSKSIWLYNRALSR